MSEPAWHPDPSGKHQYRWWDGTQWSDQVADDRVTSVDPLQASPPPAATVPAPPPPQPAPQSADAHPPSTTTGLPEPVLASKARRVGAYFMEFLLVIVTLFIGWLIWSLIVYSRGQTPAKQVLGMRVIISETKRCASWGTMALRELVLKGAVVSVAGALIDMAGVPAIDTVLSLALLLWWIAAFIMLLVDDNNQTVWDKPIGTLVINDPSKQYDPGTVNQTVQAGPYNRI